MRPVHRRKVQQKNRKQKQNDRTGNNNCCPPRVWSTTGLNFSSSTSKGLRSRTSNHRVTCSEWSYSSIKMYIIKTLDLHFLPVKILFGQQHSALSVTFKNSIKRRHWPLSHWQCFNLTQNCLRVLSIKLICTATVKVLKSTCHWPMTPAPCTAVYPTNRRLKL